MDASQLSMTASFFAVVSARLRRLKREPQSGYEQERHRRACDAYEIASWKPVPIMLTLSWNLEFLRVFV